MKICKGNNLCKYLFDDRLDAKEIKYCVCCSTNNRLRVSLSVYARNYFLTCRFLLLWEELHVERELVYPLLGIYFLMFNAIALNITTDSYDQIC